MADDLAGTSPVIASGSAVTGIGGRFRAILRALFVATLELSASRVPSRDVSPRWPAGTRKPVAD
jgi:hypothetical protein